MGPLPRQSSIFFIGRDGRCGPLTSSIPREERVREWRGPHSLSRCTMLGATNTVHNIDRCDQAMLYPLEPTMLPTPPHPTRKHIPASALVHRERAHESKLIVNVCVCVGSAAACSSAASMAAKVQETHTENPYLVVEQTLMHRKSTSLEPRATPGSCVQ